MEGTPPTTPATPAPAKTRSRRRMFLYLFLGALFAGIATLLIMNFSSSEKRIEHRIVHRYTVDDPQFRREIGTLLGPALVEGNRVQNLENGDEIFPAMLEAIRGAQHSINFETYIYWSGDIGQRFAKALEERARAGVKVHVLIDWAGSQRIEDSLLDELRESGVEVELYHPLRWYNLNRINKRTHRKLLVVDGRIGFTGGVGIADQWLGDATDPESWRDSHYRIEGPVVAQMQAAFLDNWIKTTGRVLQGEEYFPALSPAGDAVAQTFTSSPSGGGDSMQLMYLLSIAAAESTIDLSAAYFVPDPLTRKVMIDALGRGVRIRIIVPGEHMDVELVRKASRAGWGELLEAGALIHEFQPTMFHVKMLVVDRHLVSVGSTNFDNRSFRLNDEANLNVYDREFAERATRVFEADLARARQVSLQEWQHRPWRERLMEHTAALFSSQL
jgi:cardiolipin synthase